MSHASSLATPLPFTILTGWLGAGKTTTLNRLLSAPHGKRIAVLVNELGRIAIDGKLILRRGGDILELAGGCLCCKLDIRNDLWDGIADIVTRTRPDYLVLETTGIAQPMAIIEGLAAVRADVRDGIAIAGIISVVDAEVGAATMAARDEAREQLNASDRVLLTKLDRASELTLSGARAGIIAHAPHAEIASFPDDDAGAMNLCHWLLATRPLAPAVRMSLATHDNAQAAATATSHRHHHGQLHAMVFADPAPLVAAHVLEILAALGDSLARVKGFIALAGEPRLGFIEKAGAYLGITFPDPSSAASLAPARSEFVLIGDFDDAAVMRQLYACRAGADLRASPSTTPTSR
ncbi:MAG: GTP-binding protein [Myxococcales bacterium]|nr:GTP-binding protein [Myxococcales bacterium]